ncbi:hypothetical protein OSB04_017288 [Centaurea solstitialis]|uniref:Peptidase M3A/M3B catalytic domain-containing protein n=1 Tax=Centaurea solstitialis TaxID=347529 RepID=A0AA38T2L9_9ASTR|nr:hypothetical protein OSB04_017288 [Centaurea solstitialis]
MAALIRRAASSLCSSASRNRRFFAPAAHRMEETGLYGCHHLKNPKGFQRIVDDAIERSNELIGYISQMPSSAGIINAMDEISNTVCQVVDSAELCRHTHPDREFVDEAVKASMRINEYLHYLNTNLTLYDAVLKADQDPALTSEEAKRVARDLRIDFEKGGIHLCAEKKDRVSELNVEIAKCCAQYNENIAKEPGHVDVYPASRISKNLHHLVKPVNRPTSAGSRVNFREKGFQIVTEPSTVSAVLQWASDDEVRKMTYIQSNSVPRANLGVLDNLIAARHEIAQIMGYNSYAGYALHSNMASSPDVVSSFLVELSKMVQPKALEEFKSIRDFKRERNGQQDIELEPWDEAYFTRSMKSSAYNLDFSVVASYFSLSQCIEGLKLLVESLFGVKFLNIPLTPGESWHPDVMKMALHHPNEGDLGYIYLDLNSRRGKYPGCAHFAIRGGRRLSETEYQLPVIALVCNFSKPHNSATVRLNHSDVDTLFHEFGHALHSLLSRTSHHHLPPPPAAAPVIFSGKLLSASPVMVVMGWWCGGGSGAAAEGGGELDTHNSKRYYAWDYRVLKKFARHYSSGDIIPEKLVESMQGAKKMFAATELQQQIFYAMADQALYGDHTSPIDTTSIVAELREQHTNWKHVEGTHWQTRFSHLLYYGAGYYSYLYAKCFASTIWERVCKEDPLSLDTGTAIRTKFLQHGGAKDPAQLLNHLAGDGIIRHHNGENWLEVVFKKVRHGVIWRKTRSRWYEVSHNVSIRRDSSHGTSRHAISRHDQQHNKSLRAIIASFAIAIGDRSSLMAALIRRAFASSLCYTSRSRRFSAPTGLYGCDHLKNPKGFHRIVDEAIDRSNELVGYLSGKRSSAEIIKTLDEIENTRYPIPHWAQTNPQQFWAEDNILKLQLKFLEFVDEAVKASMRISEYTLHFRTNLPLYDAVLKADQDPTLTSEEAKRVARDFRNLSEKHGIHQCAAVYQLITNYTLLYDFTENRDRLSQLNVEIEKCCGQYYENIAKEPGHVDVYPTSRIPEILHHLVKPVYRPTLPGSRVKSKDKGFRIVTEPMIVSAVLQWTSNDQVRKMTYIESNSVPHANLGVLDNLIAARHEIAQISGYKSYADYALHSNMASSPDVVSSFLDELSKLVQPKAVEEFKSIRDFKRQKTGQKYMELEPWDEAYFTSLMKSSAYNLDFSVVASYFSLSQCIEGLKLLVESLFDMKFLNIPLTPGESWHPDVMKMSLHHPNEGDLGYIYLDLILRRGKYPGCANFPIRRGRRLSETEYQLPVVALVCNFSKPPNSAVVRLQHSDVEILFHEFGHALHSLLSRTDYQHFSGTRVAFDMMETPSSLFQYYAWDYRVLKKFARHYSTGDIIPEKLVESTQGAKKMFAAMKLQQEIYYAMVDQALYGNQTSPVDTTSIVADLRKQHTNWKHVEGTHWQTRFSHLLQYGAGVYTYLYAKCFASTIWERVCKEDPLSLETGTAIRTKLLQHGGAKDPAQLLSHLAGDGIIRRHHNGGIVPDITSLCNEMNLGKR